MSNRTSIIGSISQAGGLGTDVLAAAPLLELVAQLKAKRDEFARLSPNSDAAPTLAWVAGLLEEAIEAGLTNAVRLTIADAARLYGRALSSVRWECKRHANEIGAIKSDGAWTVDRVKFAAYCSTLKVRSAA